MKGFQNSWTLPFIGISISNIHLARAVASGYTLTLANSYEGSTFFDGWYYNASATDPANYGNIHYLDEASAVAANLTYITSAQTAIIKVDNVTNGVNDTTFGRNSVALITNATIDEGTLVLFDAVHIPYGCSVWPAFWTLDAATQTDVGGEIDIVEGTNNVNVNQYTLHTRPGCSQTNDTSFPTGNSTLLYTDCSGDAATGCAFQDTRTSSYGSGFASAGGGVFAMLWDGDGIQTWFFTRSSIPSDITGGSPEPWTWGNPALAIPFTGNCNSSYFSPQSLIIDIDICGSFGLATFSETCSGSCTDLVGDPTNYDNAYFEINYIKTFTGASTSLTIPSMSATTPSATSSSSSSSGAARGFSLSRGQIIGSLLALVGVAVGSMI